MPRMSEADLREWYARFSKEVYEKAQIDVTRKEDLGRIKNFEIKNWDSEHLEEVEVELSYAFMPVGMGSAPDVTDFDAYSKWMMRNLNPNMNLERIQKLYDQSCNGTLMIFQPGAGTHQSCQVYTDQYGEIHTSLPINLQDPDSNVEIPAGQEIPLPPKYVKEPHPKDYYPGYPEEPVAPENMNPSFLSMLGYYVFGMDNDYAKMVRYQKAKEEYPKVVENWLFNFNKQPGNADEYRKAQEDRLEYQTAAAEYQDSHLGKHYAIDQFFRLSLPLRDNGSDFVDMLKDETAFLKQQHDELQEKQKKALAEETHGAKEMLRYPKRTDNVLRNLVGHAPQPDTLTEWIEKNTFKEGDYKPEPYELPKSAGYENMSREKQAADQQKWAELAEIAGFAAIVDPKVMGQRVRPGFTEEENAILRYGMILNDLFTKGRANGAQHMDVLEPARKMAKEALDAYAANNPEPLVKLLTRSLRMTNREARSLTLDGTDSDHGIDTLHLINRLYNTLSGILGGDTTKLMEVSGLNQQELDETLGNVAVYEMLNRNYEAKLKLIEYGNGQRELSEKELMEAGKDMILAAMVSREQSLFYSRESDRIAATPEQAENIARMAAANKGTLLKFEIHQAQLKGKADAVQKLQAEMKKNEEEYNIATGKYNLADGNRSPYAINQNLRNPSWVKSLKNQMAEKMDLRNLMTGPREIVGNTFGQKRSVSELLDKALDRLVQTQQKLDPPKPVKDAQLAKNEQPKQIQQKEAKPKIMA